MQYKNQIFLNFLIIVVVLALFAAQYFTKTLDISLIIAYIFIIAGCLIRLFMTIRSHKDGKMYNDHK